MSKQSIAVRTVVLVMAVALLAPGALALYAEYGPARESGAEAAAAEAENIAAPQADAAESPAQATEERQAADIEARDIELTQEVLDAIRAADPVRYEQNVRNYKSLLATLDVHPSLQAVMKQWIGEGRRLPDILIAYEYLFNEFGTIDDAARLIEQRESGRSWADIIAAYEAGREPFVPQAFDPDYLETLRVSALTADDIMIADRVSHETGIAVPDIFADKAESAPDWRDYNAKHGILFSYGELPRVQLTREQLDAALVRTGWTEERVVEAYVLASRTGLAPEEAIGRLLGGQSEAAIEADSLTARYDAQ